MFDELVTLEDDETDETDAAAVVGLSNEVGDVSETSTDLRTRKIQHINIPTLNTVIRAYVCSITIFI